MEETVKEKTQKLTIEQWHDETLKGHFIPLHVPIFGVSMFPLIRYERDYVTIVPIKGEPVLGDVVLFHDSIRKRFVLHRVIHVDENTVLTRGDNCAGADRPLSTEDIWGKAVLIERGKFQIKPNPRRGMRHARCWYSMGRVYRLATRVVAAVKRRIKELGNI